MYSTLDKKEEQYQKRVLKQELLFKKRVRLLDLVNHFDGNITRACNELSVNIIFYHDCKNRFQLYGIDGLRDTPKPINRTREMIGKLIVANPESTVRHIQSLLTEMGNTIYINTLRAHGRRLGYKRTSGKWQRKQS